MRGTAKDVSNAVVLVNGFPWLRSGLCHILRHTQVSGHLRQFTALRSLPDDHKTDVRINLTELWKNPQDLFDVFLLGNASDIQQHPLSGQYSTFRPLCLTHLRGMYTGIKPVDVHSAGNDINRCYHTIASQQHPCLFAGRDDPVKMIAPPLRIAAYNSPGLTVRVSARNIIGIIFPDCMVRMHICAFFKTGNAHPKIAHHKLAVGMYDIKMIRMKVHEIKGRRQGNIPVLKCNEWRRMKIMDVFLLIILPSI